jgi:hypothetical protein
MIVLIEGESLRVPATVTGDKDLISSLQAVIKKSLRGEVPTDDSSVVANLVVTDYNSAEIQDGYMFTLSNTSVLTPGIYYINYKFTVSGLIYKGDPMKVVVKEGVI